MWRARGLAVAALALLDVGRASADTPAPPRTVREWFAVELGVGITIAAYPLQRIPAAILRGPTLRHGLLYWTAIEGGYGASEGGHFLYGGTQIGVVVPLSTGDDLDAGLGVGVGTVRVSCWDSCSEGGGDGLALSPVVRWVHGRPGWTAGVALRGVVADQGDRYAGGAIVLLSAFVGVAP